MTKSEGMSRRSFVQGGAAALLGAAAASSLNAVAFADEETESEAADATLTPGVYTAEAESIRGTMTVTVAVSETAITSITTQSPDTKHVMGAVLSTMVPAMIDNQSTEVDAVAGATYSCAALKKGVRACLEQAGAGEDDFAADCTTVAEQGEDEEFDVVVVGSGGAGLSAAIQLAQRGLRTVVLERLGYLGGTTGFSSGGVWAVGSTEFNEATGYDYDAEGLIEHMYNATGAAEGELNDELIANIAAASPIVFADYVANGAPWATTRYTFGDALEEMPVCWPTMFYGTSYENNAGMTLIDFLVRYAQQCGVDLRVNSQVTGLIADGDAVAGVEVEGLEKTYSITAKKVVLATGGFQRNSELVEELAPQHVTMVPFTSAGSQGDGIVFAREFGAATCGSGIGGSVGLNEHIGYVGSWGLTTYASNLRVNKEGVRFYNEAGHYSTYPDAICSQTDGLCYGIVDSANASLEAVQHLVDRGLAVQADTLEELAELIEVPSDALVATVEQYNADAADAGDTEFGVPQESMTPASEAPFYAIPTRLVASFSLAGLKVNENCNVLKEDGTKIENLFAAGEVAAGNFSTGIYAGSGSQIGPCMYEGYLIGDQVLAEIEAEA